MSNALDRSMTPEEFLAWEEGQELKWEFDGFQPVAMTGGTDAHSAIQGSLITALNVRLRGSRCRPCGPDVKVEANGRFRYPDAFVTCKPVPFDATVVTEPVVIFEVLSKSTERSDRTMKLMEYQSIPALQRYVMLEHDQALATVITRRDGRWLFELLRADAALAMTEIGIEIPLAEIYDDVSFPPEPDPG